MTTNTIKKKSVYISPISYSKYLLLLMKPRVMSLVIFTCAVGLLTAPVSVSFLNSIIAIFFVTMGAGAAGALNMWYEADLDKLMTRTCLRPIPTGKVNREHALLFFKFNISYFIIYNNRILCFCLHDLVKKKNAPKYCYWRRIRRTATSYRLDYSYQLINIRTDNIFLNNILLDPISFLGIEPLQSRRLSEG